MSTESGETWTIDTELSGRTIEDVDLNKFAVKPIAKFTIAFAIGAFFFLLPVPWKGEITVPFDIAVSYITANFPDIVGIYALIIIVLGAILTVLSKFGIEEVGPIELGYYESSNVFLALRVIGAMLAPVMFLHVGPEWLWAPGIGGFMWQTLVYSVGVIIPIGAVFITIFVELGGLEFIGTVARPVMKPLFRVPGRAALDSLASWVGSYSVGLYVTRNVFERGGYNKREVFTISTCFSTVSIGFVGVVAATLNLLPVFPLIFLAYFINVIICAVILVRIPPISTTSSEYIAEPDPELPFSGSPSDYLQLALSEAVKKAEEGESFFEAAKRGFVDGLKLTSLILGTILAVGLAAVLLSEYTPTFEILGAPLAPILSMLGLPSAENIAPAVIVGITEMYVPVLLAKDAARLARFFIAVLSVSQLIFFSSVAPMILDMFSDVPIRFRDLIALFIMRTIILVPLTAAMTQILAALKLL